MFDMHRRTREERFPVDSIVSLIEVDSLFFLAFFFSFTKLFNVRPTWIDIGVEGWEAVSEFPSHE